MGSPCKPRTAQGFFLGVFHCAYLGLQALGFCFCRAPRDILDCKTDYTRQFSWIEMQIGQDNEIANSRASNYRCVGHLLQGSRERISSLHYIVSFINWNWALFYFEKLPDSVQYIRLWLTIDACLLLYLEIMFFCCISLPHLNCRALKLLSDFKLVHGAKKVGDCWVKAICKSSYCYISKAPSSGISSCPSRGLFCGCTKFPTSHFLIFTSCFQAQAEQKPSISCPGSCAEVAWTDAFINSAQ